MLATIGSVLLLTSLGAFGLVFFGSVAVAEIINLRK